MALGRVSGVGWGKIWVEYFLELALTAYSGTFDTCLLSGSATRGLQSIAFGR